MGKGDDVTENKTWEKNRRKELGIEPRCVANHELGMRPSHEFSGDNPS